MIQHMTPDRIANSIMQDSSFNGIYLIVEGNKDYKFYSKFISSDIKIKESWGCEKVKGVLNILDERGFCKKVGIIDSDFSLILDESLETKDLFVTDYHDIEVMMVKSNALNVVLNLFCQRERIEEFNQEEVILETILNLGTKIGLLKLANKINNLGLVFKPERPEGNQLKYKEFISERDLSFIGEDKMIQTVINYSRNRSSMISTLEEIEEKLLSLSQNTYTREHLVNGHDLSNIIFILLKKVLKSSNRMLFDFNSVEDSLILAYEGTEFVKTQLFSKLYKWGQDNGVNFFKENLVNIYAQHEMEEILK